MNATIEMIKTLPPDIRREVLDFAQFLMGRKRSKRVSQPVKQGWAGALREFKGQFTSLELQKKAQEWRV